MKKILAIAVLVLIAGTSFAQKEEEPDTLVVKIGKKVIVIQNNEDENEIIIDENGFEKDNTEEDKKSEAHWSGIDVGVNTFLNSAQGTDFPTANFLEIDPSKSWNWNLNFMEGKLDIIKGYVGVTSGLGLNVTNFSFRNNYIYNYDAGNDNTPGSITASKDTVVNYSKNKLRTTYLTVPVLLEFTTNRDKGEDFYLAAGLVGGVKLITKLKRESDQSGYERKFSEKGDYGVNPFKVDALVKLGYGDWGVYASYNLMPTFDTDLTAQANQFSFGLSYSF